MKQKNRKTLSNIPSIKTQLSRLQNTENKYKLPPQYFTSRGYSIFSSISVVFSVITWLSTSSAILFWWIFAKYYCTTCLQMQHYKFWIQFSVVFRQQSVRCPFSILDAMTSHRSIRLQNWRNFFLPNLRQIDVFSTNEYPEIFTCIL